MTRKARYKSEIDWHRLLALYIESGKSIESFCSEHNLCQLEFEIRLNRLRSTLHGEVKAEEPSSNFHPPISIPLESPSFESSIENEAEYEIHLKSGCRIVIRGVPTMTALERIVKVLEK